MVRATKINIYKKILSSLETASLNTHQIATKLDMNWETVNNALEILEELNVVKQEKNLFTLQSSLKEESLHSKTIFDLPLSKDQEKLFCQLANRIKELSPRPLKQTFLQKAVVEVIKRANIENLPYGWYLYGQCCVHKLSDTSGFSSTTKYDTFIIPILDEFSKFNRVDDLLEYLYSKENNELYLSKLNVIHLLNQTSSIASNDIINRELMRMVLYLYRNGFSEEDVSYLEYFTSSMAMLSKLPIEEFERIRINILGTFTTCWNYIATLYFERSLKSYYSSVSSFTQSRIIVIKELLEPQLLELKTYWPKIELNPKLDAFRASLAKKSQ